MTPYEQGYCDTLEKLGGLEIIPRLRALGREVAHKSLLSGAKSHNTALAGQTGNLSHIKDVLRANVDSMKTYGKHGLSALRGDPIPAGVNYPPTRESAKDILNLIMGR